MRSSELKKQITKNELQATIFGYADANHYLVGAEDNKGNFYALCDDKDEAVLFNSMYEAESCLRSMGVESAYLHLQTAYDEMVGNEVAQDTRLAINLSHH